MTASVILAVEDALSEAVGASILGHQGIGVAQTIGRRGFGYLKRKAGALNMTARGFPVVMITDLDSPTRCPADLVVSWIGGARNPSFLLRVAVLEVESWVMADRTAFAQFAKVSPGRVPQDTDAVDDPKRFLVNLFRSCKDSALRRDMVPSDGSTAPVGPSYNARLTRFVESSWNPASAARCSASLGRALDAIARLRSSNG